MAVKVAMAGLCDHDHRRACDAQKLHSHPTPAATLASHEATGPASQPGDSDEACPTAHSTLRSVTIHLEIHALPLDRRHASREDTLTLSPPCRRGAPSATPR